MRSFLRAAALFVCAAATLLSAGCGIGTDAARMRAARIRYMGTELGVTLEGAELVSLDDSHGGFHGDGILFAVLDCSAAPPAHEKAAHWKELPLTENLAKLASADYISAKDSGPLFPRIENGLYFFKDRYSDLWEWERYSDANVLNRYSENFTLAIYDADTQTLYYCRIDT